jgi:ABC-type sugar transport system ATPase subunit
MQSQLIVMDEPTAALSSTEVENLFDIVGSLKREGLSIIFVTHRLEEVLRICDRLTVLRDGRFAGGGTVAETTVTKIIQLMVGRDVSIQRRKSDDRAIGPVALEVKNLSRRQRSEGHSAMALKEISVSVRAGEILGIAGLVGSGRSETARAIFGADAIDQGEIVVSGQGVRMRSPRDAIKAGIGLVPEDRKQQALFLGLSIRENLSLTVQDRISWLRTFVDLGAERNLVEDYRRRLNIRMANEEQSVADLSGGNQQKVVLARWLALRPKVLIVDEPTRGIDIGAKAEVHNVLFELARQGIAVVVISSELPEVLAVSDRIVTMRAGVVTGEVSADTATPEMLMSLMTIGQGIAA